MLQKIKLILVINIAFLYIFIAQNAFASTATMALSPASGAFDKPFTVSLVIDGHGDKFNAAQSTISLSYGLAIRDLVLGDCNLSFLKTPSIQEPSFSGIILSSYSTKCTVYTLTVVPTAKTKAAITLSKSSVRRYGDAANILSATSGGSYDLTAALKAPKTPVSQSENNSKNELYIVNIKVVSNQNTPVNNATVILNNVSDKRQQQTTTDKTGTAHFSSLKTGIYDAMVKVNNSKAGETIINVSGQNHVLTFGINLNGQQSNPLLKNSGSVLGIATSSPFITAAIAALGIIIGAVITVLFIRFRGSRTDQVPAQ